MLPMVGLIEQQLAPVKSDGDRIMTYEEIRAARLQHPFRPFTLRMKNGHEHLIREPETLAITPLNLVFWDSDSRTVVMSSANEVESLTYVDQTSKASA